MSKRTVKEIFAVFYNSFKFSLLLYFQQQINVSLKNC